MPSSALPLFFQHLVTNQEAASTFFAENTPTARMKQTNILRYWVAHPELDNKAQFLLPLLENKLSTQLNLAYRYYVLLLLNRTFYLSLEEPTCLKEHFDSAFCYNFLSCPDVYYILATMVQTQSANSLIEEALHRISDTPTVKSLIEETVLFLLDEEYIPPMSVTTALIVLSAFLHQLTMEQQNQFFQFIWQRLFEHMQSRNEQFVLLRCLYELCSTVSEATIEERAQIDFKFLLDTNNKLMIRRLEFLELLIINNENFRGVKLNEFIARSFESLPRLNQEDQRVLSSSLRQLKPLLTHSDYEKQYQELPDYPKYNRGQYSLHGNSYARNQLFSYSNKEKEILDTYLTTDPVDMAECFSEGLLTETVAFYLYKLHAHEVSKQTHTRTAEYNLNCQ
ncbi:hypothetical protein [Legionella bononiensis]|uniref:Uncharacterized protein n=1 Tax=Legionella bononiensis TaxID=2793102 RepID=A0ABS1W6V0_9GAMM|nr:hypothetical protein [Legionella bononiensis]MBL7478453.1 hypothetical protein [Legionella bononiensis]MBL7525050.1 hypothetical protein [Legionella bononiensis]MBL7561346.1 hypothetical protein [Legionella bononiensis]